MHPEPKLAGAVCLLVRRSGGVEADLDAVYLGRTHFDAHLMLPGQDECLDLGTHLFFAADTRGIEIQLVVDLSEVQQVADDAFFPEVLAQHRIGHELEESGNCFVHPGLHGE